MAGFQNWNTPPEGMAGQPPGGPSPFELPPPQDPRTFPLTRGPKFKKEFQDQAIEFLTYEFRISAELVRQKVNRWKLLEGLYQNTRRLSDWHKTTAALAADRTVIDSKRWQADFIMSAAPVIHSFVDRIYNSLFKAREYFTVECDPVPGNIEDPGFPTSKKMQAHLMRKNKQAFFKNQMYAILTDHALFGTVLTKSFWYRKEFSRYRRDPMGQPVLVPEAREFPLIEAIPLDMALIDYGAKHSDCQRWGFVGHRTFVPYERVKERFANGDYNLNRAEFEKRWSEGSITQMDQSDRTNLLWRDPHLWAVSEKSENKSLVIWEGHGHAPAGDDTYQEVIITVITDRPDDDPVNGLCVRLEPGPALEWGERPFHAAHFTPLAGPFGQSAVEPQLDLIYYMSHMVNVVLDNARLQTNTMLKVRRDSAIHRELVKNKKGDVIYPGKVWFEENEGDIKPMEPLQLPSQAMTNLIQYFEHKYERQTNVSDTTLGMAQRQKTATEAYQLGQMADVPLAARVDLFVEHLFEPYGNTALNLIQHNTLEQQEVRVQDPYDKEVSKVLSMPEIQTGKYIVKAALDIEDQARVAKLQTLERLTPVVSQMAPLMLTDGTNWSPTNWLRMIMEIGGVGDKADMVLPRVDQQQMASLQTLKQMPPQLLQQLMQVPPELLGPVIQAVMQIVQQQMQQQQMAQGQGNGGPPPTGQNPPQLEPGPSFEQGGMPGQNMMRQPAPMGKNGTPMGSGDHGNQGVFAQMLQMLSGHQGGMLQ